MPPRLPRLLATLAVVLLGAAPVLEAQAVLGPARSIPDEPSCSPLFPDLAALPDGGFWAVWSEVDPETGARRLLGRELQADARHRSEVISLDPLGPNGVRPRTAVASDGTRVVAWNDGEGFVRARGFDPDGSPLGPSFRLFRSDQPPGSVAAGPDGSFLVTGLEDRTVLAARFAADGSGLVSTREILDGNVPRQVLGTLLTNDDAVLAVRREPLPQPLPALELWRLASDGEIDRQVQVPGAFETALASRPDEGFLIAYRGGLEVVAEIRRADLSLVSSFELERVPGVRVVRPPGLAVSPDGETFVFIWTEISVPPQLPGDPPPLPATIMLAERYGLDGTRQGVGQVLFSVEGEHLDRLTPRLAFTPAGHLGTAWWVSVDFVIDPIPPCLASDGAFARSTAPSCGGDPETTLCLQDQRFALTVDWSDPRSGAAGAGHPVDLTGDTGAFWFFDPDNLEMMVKVIDGRPVNDHFWLFYGSLTDVEFTLTVTDRDTGVERTFTKPPFVFASEGDTTGFPAP